MIKRFIDIVISSLAILVLSPLYLFIAVLVRYHMGTPILFRQKRPGLQSKIFEMIKFRTMRDEFDGDGMLLPDSDRLTRLGRFLRASSLDELPELWNVLRGDMSLVGPRPLLVEYLDYYTPEQARRHHVKPGITGWAQINGRQSISFSKRLELDVFYVDNFSLIFDIKILFLTLPRVFMSTGIINGQDVADVDDIGFSSKQAKKSKEK